jgi:hypothetical protein
VVNLIKKQIEIISHKITKLLGISFEDVPYKREHTKLHRMEIEAISMIFNCLKTLADRLYILEDREKERINSEKIDNILSESEKKIYGIGGKDETKSK